MENLVLFAVTTLVYLGIWCWMKRPSGLVECAKRAGIMALLCAPFNINGHIVTIFGNAISEKNNLAVCSLYQVGRNTITLIGLSGYQSAGQDAVTVIGLSGYQSAGRDARTDIGLSGYQSAGQDAVTIIGLSGYQSAERNAITGIGLSGYQSAGRDAITDIGLAIYQKAGKNTRTFGVFSKLSAK